MPLKAVVTDINTVPEAARPLYVERDGAHWLDVEAADHGGRKVALEDITGLLNAKSAQQQRADQAEAKLRGFGDLTPDQARAAIDKAERLSKIDPQSEAAKLAEERIRANAEDYAKKLAAEKTPLEAKLAKALRKVEKTTKGDRLKGALKDAGAVPEAWPLLESYADAHIQVKETEDDFEAVVVDAKGNPRVSMTPGSIEQMGIDEFVRSLRAVFPSCFIGENASGSGSSVHGSANNNGGGGVRRIPRGDQAAINANWQDIAAGKAVVV